MIAIQYPGVLVGRVFFFEDIAAYFEPLWTEAARQMRAGHVPSWAPGAWSGQPLLGDPQIGVFYPLHWLWLVLAPLRVYAISVPLHAFIAGAGMYASARESGRSAPAATAAAIALALSAFYVLEARHIMFLASAAWVPWLLWAIERTVRRGRWSDVAWVALFGALALLGGGWSMLVFAAPPLAVFTVTRLRSGRPILLLVAGTILAIGLSAVQLLPAFAHTAVSPRALPLSDAFAGSFSWPSLRYAVSLALPLWFGDEAQGTYRGAGDQWELCGYGMGLVAAALAMWALFTARRRGRERLGYVLVLGLSLVLALGEHGPCWRAWRALPLLARLRCPARVLFAFTVVLPILLARGVDRLAALTRLRLHWRSRWTWLVPLAIAGELLGTFRADNPTVPLAATEITPEVLRDGPPPDGRTLLDVHLGQPFHNGGLRWGFDSPGGYSSLPLWRYLHMLWIANHNAPYPGWPLPRLSHDLTAQGLWTLSSPIVDLLNVRWLVAPRTHPPAGSGWALVKRGEDRVDLWRNDEALARRFVVYEEARVADEAEAALAIADPAFSFARTAVVEQPSLGPAGLLVFSEPYDPSFTVNVDGERAALLRVDYALMGVALPRPEARVELVRVDRPLRLGALVTVLSLVVLLLLVGAGARRGAPSC